MSIEETPEGFLSDREIANLRLAVTATKQMIGIVFKGAGDHERTLLGKLIPNDRLAREAFLAVMPPKANRALFKGKTLSAVGPIGAQRAWHTLMGNYVGTVQSDERIGQRIGRLTQLIGLPRSDEVFVLATLAVALYRNGRGTRINDPPLKGIPALSILDHPDRSIDSDESPERWALLTGNEPPLTLADKALFALGKAAVDERIIGKAYRMVPPAQSRYMHFLFAVRSLEAAGSAVRDLLATATTEVSVDQLSVLTGIPEQGATNTAEISGRDLGFPNAPLA